MAQRAEVRYVVDFGDVLGKRITLLRPPTAREINLLFILAEADETVVHPDQICARLRTSINSVRIHATFLRKKLTRDWIIHSATHRGMRLLHLTEHAEEKDGEALRYITVDEHYTRRHKALLRNRVRLIQESTGV